MYLKSRRIKERKHVQLKCLSYLENFLIDIVNNNVIGSDFDFVEGWQRLLKLNWYLLCIISVRLYLYIPSIIFYIFLYILQNTSNLVLIWNIETLFSCEIIRFKSSIKKFYLYLYITLTVYVVNIKSYIKLTPPS